MTQENTSTSASAATPNKALNIGLWVVQALLAFAFAGAAMMKLTTPFEELASGAEWAQSTGVGFIRFIGFTEALAVLGLILPAATRIKPILTPLAASGLVVIMVLAAGVHLNYGESPVPNIVLGALAAFVAWGRFKGAPIAAK